MNSKIGLKIYTSIVILIAAIFTFGYAGLLGNKAEANIGSTPLDSEPIIYFHIANLKDGNNIYKLPNDPSIRARYYNEMIMLQTLQGIVNKDKPRLFLEYSELDYVGRDGEMFSHICGGSRVTTCSNPLNPYFSVEGRPIIIEHHNESYPTYQPRISVNDFIKKYFIDSPSYTGPKIEGLVLWDYNVHASVNAAVSISGPRNLLAVRNNSPEYVSYIQAKLGLNIVENLEALNFRDVSRVPEFPYLTSTGSAKNNMYYWLVEKYLKPRATTTNPDRYINPKYLGYYVDAYTSISDPNGVVGSKDSWSSYSNGTSHLDYMVANSGLVFDLSPWDDEPPTDEPNQPKRLINGAYKYSDRSTMQYIFSTADSMVDGMIYGHGFLPWIWKYSSDTGHGNHTAVSGEWEQINLMSENGIVNVSPDAESTNRMGHMPNTSFLRHLTDYNFLKLNTPKTVNSISLPPLGKRKTYIMITMGDFDSPSWAYHQLYKYKDDPENTGSTYKEMWTDPERTGALGEPLPLLWGVNPSIFLRNPILKQLLNAKKTPNDYFGALQGYGYVDLDLYYKASDPKRNFDLRRETRQAYLDLGYDLTGFYIHTKQARSNNNVWNNYARAVAAESSNTGFVQYAGSTDPDLLFYELAVHQKIPFTTSNVTIQKNLTPDLASRVKEIAKIGTEAPLNSDFINLRSVLITPSELKQTINELKRQYPERNYEVVDPYTFFYILNLQNQDGWTVKGNFTRETQAKSYELLPDKLLASSWEGDVGYDTFYPISNGLINWNRPTINLSLRSLKVLDLVLPHKTPLTNYQAEDSYVLNNSITKTIWIDNNRYMTTQPLANIGELWKSNINMWQGPVNISQLRLPLDGDITAQASYIANNTYTEEIWIGNNAFYRKVPINNSQLMWGSSSGWIRRDPNSLPGNGNLEAHTFYHTPGGELYEEIWRNKINYIRRVN